MPSHHLSTLGVPLLRSETGEPVRFRTRKHLALLIRLAVEAGKRLSRDYLQELLWPEVPAHLARHSLAQAISVLKAKVGSGQIVIQRATVALAAGAVDVDIHQVGTESLEVRGRFLEGFDVPGAREFEQWKDEWYARLAPKIRDTLVRQMDAGRRIGDFETVERRAQVLIDLDPTSEDGVRGLMEARAFVGDRSNALKAFARYEDLLVEEFAAQPAADLVRMADLLREGRRSPPHVGVVEHSSPQPPQRRFEGEFLIGREREFSGLYDAWVDVRGGVPRMVVLTGDPGMGKTTLANAFASTCQMEGAVIARAQAYDAERELPFAVLAELVRQLTTQRAIGAADPEALSELSRVSPEILQVFPGVPKPVDWSPEITPLRLADAFLKTVTAAAEGRPLLLIVDDIHSADSATAAILHVVARKLVATRVMVILTARPSELRVTAAPAALASDNSIVGMCTLELDPLPPEAAAALATRLAGGEVVAGSGHPPTDRILRAGSGNPLAIELLMKEWTSHGQTSLLRDLEALNTQPAATVGIPRAIGTVFERQVRRLDPTTRAALDLAAVLGRRLTDLPLYKAVELSSVAAAEALSRLKQEEGFLREVGGELEFRNELIRAQTYYAVAGKARKHLHRQVAMLLAKEAPGNDGPSNLEVAWHFLRAGDPQGAAPYALEGAETAVAVGGPHEAEQILEALLTSALDQATERRARLVLARALLEQSKAQAAAPLLRILREDSALEPAQQAEVSGLFAKALYLANDSGACEAAGEALQSARQTGDLALIARALFEYARTGIEEGRSERVEAAAAECDRLLQLPGGSQEPMIFYAKAFCDYYSFEVDRAEVNLLTAISLLDSSAQPVRQSQFYTGLGVCRLANLEPHAALEAYARAVQLASNVGDDSRTSLINNARCAAEGIRGDFPRAIEYALESIALGRRALNQPSLVSAYLNLAELYALTGEIEKERGAFDSAQALLPRGQTWWTRVDFALHSASSALIHGNIPLALEYVSEAEILASGRECAAQDAGVLQKFRAFRAFHEQGPQEALSIAREAMGWFRGRNHLYYYTVLVVSAWAERMMRGDYSRETAQELQSFNHRPISGRKTLFAAQGFLTS